MNMKTLPQAEEMLFKALQTANIDDKYRTKNRSKWKRNAVPWYCSYLDEISIWSAIECRDMISTKELKILGVVYKKQ